MIRKYHNHKPQTSLKSDILKYRNIMNLNAFKISGNFAVCKQFRPRLATTELLIYTRDKSTMGAKRLVGRKDEWGRNDQGENDQGGNVLGRND